MEGRGWRGMEGKCDCKVRGGLEGSVQGGGRERYDGRYLSTTTGRGYTIVLRTAVSTVGQGFSREELLLVAE